MTSGKNVSMGNVSISCEVALQRLYRKKRYTNNLESIVSLQTYSTNLIPLKY